MATIHPSALVDAQAKLHETVKIGPFCIIGPNVEVGANTILHSHVVVDGHTTIGEGNQFFQGCSIGAPPQDNSYKGEPTKTVIGNNNTFREYVSIHRGTLKENLVTQIGSKCLFMAYVHAGHDVVIGNNCTIANSTKYRQCYGSRLESIWDSRGFFGDGIGGRSDSSRVDCKQRKFLSL